MNSQQTMLEDFEHKGHWWLPGNPSNQIAGTLYFKNENHIKLELVSCFDLETTIRDFESCRAEIILGILDSGSECTLIINYPIRKLSFGAHVPMVYRSELLLMGKHFNTQEDMRFNSVSVNFTNLERWLGLDPFKASYKDRKPSCEYIPPESIEVALPDLALKFSSVISFSRGATDVGMRCTAFLTVEPSVAQGYGYFSRLLFDFNSLLTLFIGQTVFIKKMTAEISSAKSEQDVKVRSSVDVYFSRKKPNVRDNISAANMTIPFGKISERFVDIVSLWYSNKDKLRSVYELFLGTFYNPYMYPQFHFLSLTQALESFHRITQSGKYLSDEEWEPFKNEMCNAIPPELDESHKASLKSRIKYGNEHSLRKRMSDLVSSLDSSVAPPQEYFSGAIVDARHYFTHYDEELKKGEIKGEELDRANQRLEVLITLLLLREIGIDEKEAFKCLLDSGLYGDIIPKG